jgi:hypothetical protein
MGCFDGLVGIQGIPTSVATGSTKPVALGNQTQLLVQDWGPRYAEMGARKVLFSGANQAGQAITHLNATATGLILINPLGSGVNLWLVEILLLQTSVAAATADAGVTLAANLTPLALSQYTLTTPLPINPTLLGGSSNSQAKLCSSATLPGAPVVVRALWQPSISATASTDVPPFIKDEVAGAIGIAPGCAVSLSANSALSALASFTWAELPLAA